MDKLLYIAMSGAKQTMLAQNVHSNNLANVSTDGFKAELVQARSMPVYGNHFPSRVYSMTEQPSVDFSHGSPIETNRDLDLMIEGDGWFSVLDETGAEAFTRVGNFSIDTAGYMRTQNGDILMGNAGPIILPPYEKVEIGHDGTVTVQALGQGPETLVEIDRIKLVNPNNVELQKNPDGLFRRTDGQEELPAAEIRIRSGFLESSNANPVHSLLEIMSLSKQFEMQVKLMKKAEEMDTASARIMHFS